MQFVIACEDEQHGNLFWSMDLGWTSYNEATLFDEHDKDHTDPPPGGFWLPYPGRKE